MHIDTSEIQAEVYAKNNEKDIHYVKVTIPSLHMYINSITVRPSKKFGDMWFQMPAFCIGRSWVKPIEFSGDSQFQDLLKDAAFRAVEEYNSSPVLTDIEDIDMDKAIDDALKKL